MRSIVGSLKPWVWGWLLLYLLNSPLAIAADNTAAGDNPAEVMQQFTKADHDDQTGVHKISDHRKQQIMFIMGIALLIFIVTTVSLGIAMVVFAKPVFVAHMIFAGFSLTLAVAHTIVAIVWFFPK
ncbi:MAG: hypothetical protein P8164_05670 [Gammaproteobacteria bacterium]|jgi:uncharacterized membrane protein